MSDSNYLSVLSLSLSMIWIWQDFFCNPTIPINSMFIDSNITALLLLVKLSYMGNFVSILVGNSCKDATQIYSRGVEKVILSLKYFVLQSVELVKAILTIRKVFLLNDK